MIENISSSIKLAMFFAKILKDPEQAIIGAIDDFKNEDNANVSELKASLCKKLECENINIVPGDECVYIEFSGIQKPLDIFTINIVGYVYKILDKTKLLISMFAPDINIEEVLKELSVTYNEIENNVLIEFPIKGDIVALEVKYISEEHIASIEIPIKSDKVLEKLKEMQ